MPGATSPSPRDATPPRDTALPAPATLSLADHVCLAIIGEGPTHGWALVKALHPDGGIGRIWSLSRALTYRSIDRLVDGGFVARTDAGRRAELRITARGRRRRLSWLRSPVDHLRDLRTEFLLKLTLCDRAGLATHPLIDAQHERLAPAIRALTEQRSTDAVDLWRQESARAADRFLERVAHGNAT